MRAQVSQRSQAVLQRPYPSNVGKLSRNLPMVQAMRGAPKLTTAGLNFLKCAFAPPDFAFTGDMGIPDKSPVRRLLKRHRLVSPFIVPSDQDRYFVILPTPGVAAWTCTAPAGVPIPLTQVFTPIQYSDYSSLFGASGITGSEANIVTAFRYVSNAFELVPTANEMTWSGNIQIWKAPVKLELRSSSASPVASFSVSGLQSVNGNNADMYVDKFTRGGYSMAAKCTSEFEWQQIVEAQNNLPTSLGVGDFGQLAGGTNGAITGIGQMDAIIVKISGVSADETCILKFWSCVEYQVNPGTSLYEYSHSGAPCDELALQVYNEVAKTLPVGVSYLDNDTFWQRVLRIIRAASGGLSVLPGPYGVAFSGVNAITTALEELTT